MTSGATDIQKLVRANGNVASRALLLAEGVSAAAIDAARRSGALLKLRKAMYALPEADIDQRRAVRLGGRIGCVSALRRIGVWGGNDPYLHVHVPTSASRLHIAEVVHLGRDPATRRTDLAFCSEPGQPRVHWQKRASVTPSWGFDWVADPFAALRQAVLCLDEEHAIAAIDSALQKAMIRDPHLDRLFRQLPARLAHLREEIDPLADSGPESIVRVRLRRAGFVVQPQIQIPGSSRLDLLIDGVVGLDIDSHAWHGAKRQVIFDYDKTIQSMALGLPTIRILPHHIFEFWPSTLAAIAREVSDRTELRTLRRRFRKTGRFTDAPSS